ncbi:MAG: hypothetical protein HN341_14390 [Verrucomicrobia bacterium]|jgi:hypothetical protein|nr:hypothetical protein [Verrucomicrobiota bacterium]
MNIMLHTHNWRAEPSEKRFRDIDYVMVSVDQALADRMMAAYVEGPVGKDWDVPGLEARTIWLGGEDYVRSNALTPEGLALRQTGDYKWWHKVLPFVPEPHAVRRVERITLRRKRQGVGFVGWRGSAWLPSCTLQKPALTAITGHGSMSKRRARQILRQHQLESHGDSPVLMVGEHIIEYPEAFAVKLPGEYGSVKFVFSKGADPLMVELDADGAVLRKVVVKADVGDLLGHYLGGGRSRK